MSKSVIISAPSQKAINSTRQELESATLANIAAVIGTAGAHLGDLSSAAKALTGSMTRAVLRVIHKETVSDVVGPLREAIGNAGKGASNLSTIRSAVIKVRVAFGEGMPVENAGNAGDGEPGPLALKMERVALPFWETVAEAKDAGDKCVKVAVNACLNFTSEGATVNPAGRDEMFAKIKAACDEFALSEDSYGKIKAQYFKALTAAVGQAAADAEAAAEQAEQEAAAADDAQLIADEQAQLMAELDLLRQIAAEAKRIFAKDDDAELLAEMKITDAA
ncbi:hypothetical protein H4CHR_02962 [Variovorax sp. PBS-H4]|uniref:hypothetical protein n=1 Tax=Variovorax sp. PBS-H4 TaxID=434008 RepID=UPI0013169D50|nr:hypothetical protein [Variovorax sp. PBS-H4]VTU32195.1 hypothetical protein H4CHR_02962 [Variovorax sp. PBS-H4]